MTALVACAAAPAQIGGVAFPSSAAETVLADLARECYEAGMTADMPTDSIMDCGVVLEERTLGAAPSASSPVETVVVRHRLRFSVIARGDEARVLADAWTETEELGTVIDEPITSEEYLRRLESALTDLGRRPASPDAALPWAGRYDSEQAWRLDAHLRAVRDCDGRLSSMTLEALRSDLESIGVLPLSDDLRGRCEQLYEHLYAWGLARGNESPTVDAYASYRAALPPDQRTCVGRLALHAVCR